MTTGWGIIGIGRHAGSIMAPAIQKAKGSRLVGVCSRDPQRARDFAQKHGAPKTYATLDTMLDDPEVGVVYIATPNNLHAAQTIKAAQAGKHVLCEKPLALTAADAQLMIDACARHKVKLGVAFQSRCHPAHVEARRLVASGEAGDVTMAHINFSMAGFDRPWPTWRADFEAAGGGTIMAVAVHSMDLLRFLLGREVETVTALTDLQPPQRPVDDVVVALLKFRDGPWATLVSSRFVAYPQNDVVLHGTKLRLSGLGTMGPGYPGELEITGAAGANRTQYTHPESFRANYIAMVEAFNGAVAQGGEPVATGLDGLEVVRITEAIMTSSAKGRVVRLSK